MRARALAQPAQPPLDLEALGIPQLYASPLAQRMPMWLLVIDWLQHRVHYASPNLTELVGSMPMTGTDLWAASRWLHPADAAICARGLEAYFEVLHRLGSARHASAQLICFTRLRTSDDGYRWWRLQINAGLGRSAEPFSALAIWGTPAHELARMTAAQSSIEYLDPAAKDRAAVIGAADRPECASQLTPREREVLGLVVEGLTSLQIAQRLNVAKTTIDTHRQNILQKLKCRNVVDLTLTALAMGIV